VIYEYPHAEDECYFSIECEEDYILIRDQRIDYAAEGGRAIRWKITRKCKDEFTEELSFIATYTGITIKYKALKALEDECDGIKISEEYIAVKEVNE